MGTPDKPPRHLLAQLTPLQGRGMSRCFNKRCDKDELRIIPKSLLSTPEGIKSHYGKMPGADLLKLL